MQIKRINNILNDYNCEVAFTRYDKIAFRYYGIRYIIEYKEESKTYSFGKYIGRYEGNEYVCEGVPYKELKRILINYFN